MTVFICSRHKNPGCRSLRCRGARRRHEEQARPEGGVDDPQVVASPLSLLHQAVYGGWSSDDSDCGRGASSSDSGSPGGGCD